MSVTLRVLPRGNLRDDNVPLLQQAVANEVPTDCVL